MRHAIPTPFRHLRTARSRPAVFQGIALAALLVLTGISSGCATAPQRPSGDDSGIQGGVMITRAQIERSRATTALEALERARTHLMIQRTREGSPPRITHRGVDSISHDPDILVVVDGQPMQRSVQALQNIQAEHVEFMKVFSSREATPVYGLLAGNGVVYVRTSGGRRATGPGSP